MLCEKTQVHLKKNLFANTGSYFVAMIHNHLFPSVELNAVSHKAGHIVLLKI